MTKLIDLWLIAIVDVLPRTKDLDSRESGIPHSLEPHSSEPVANEQVGREYKVHRMLFGSSRTPSQDSKEPPECLVSRNLSMQTRFRSALQSAVVQHDRFDARHIIGRCYFIAHLLQSFFSSAGKTGLEIKDIRLPLLVEARQVDRVLRIHMKVEYIEDDHCHPSRNSCS